MNHWRFWIGFAVLSGVLFLVGCSEDEDCPTVPAGAPEIAYVGSGTCGAADCHQAIHEVFAESGHPYKFTLIEDGQPPSYPWDSEHNGGIGVVGPPGGAPWDDYTGVIGGYGWKSRFVLPDGNVDIGPAKQYNFETEEWVAYNDGSPTEYNYSCFRCHTTGAEDIGEWKPGIEGTFAFGGVQCEECHGMGSQHAFDPQFYPMTIDRSAASCGECHYRDSAHRIAVSGGFVKHHEQYDELIHSPHATMGCVDCHDPHASVIFDELALGEGVRTSCTTADCHEASYASGGSENSHIAGPECVDCHMPQAAKSAVASNVYNGDIHSHLFAINTDAVGKETMWTEDGAFVAVDEHSQAKLTLDFACYGCHRDESGEGGNLEQEKSLEQLSAKATGIHSTDQSKFAAKVTD